MATATSPVRLGRSWLVSACARARTARQEPGNEGWVQELRTHRFEYVYDQEFYRLWRYLHPEELLAHSDLDGQATALGNWIVESFALLAARPPQN
jgi:hypothetical protein